MHRLHLLLGISVFFLVLQLAGGAASADRSPQVLKLQALVDSDQAVRSALVESLEAADWKGIATLDAYYDFVDQVVRHVPKARTILPKILEFYYLIDQSDALKENTKFQSWLTGFAASWGTFLDTPASIAGLETFYDDPSFNMDEYFVGPSGWLTFNQFFARELKPGKRPIADRKNDDTIVSPADSVLKAKYSIDADDEIVVKGIAHSVLDLLDDSEYAAQFSGGTYIHAFLNVNDYHRFHIPVSGTIVEKKIIPGLFSLGVKKAADGQLIPSDGDSYQFRQQRGLIVIDTPNVGLVAVLPIGMAMVSSVHLTPDVGAQVEKGDQFGFFQFGGSDIVLVFQEGKVEVTAELGKHHLVGEAIARAR